MTPDAAKPNGARALRRQWGARGICVHRRFQLLQHAQQPNLSPPGSQRDRLEPESPLEREVAKRLAAAGYRGDYVLLLNPDTVVAPDTLVELVEAVRAAASGKTYLHPELGARIAAEPPAPAGPPDDLTEREIEILRLIALGHTNTEIAEQLFLSVRTVESHRARIQQKTGLNTRAELVRYALDHDLIER